MSTPTRTYDVGDKVTPDPNGYGVSPSIIGQVFTVAKVNRVNLTCTSDSGGQGLRYPPELLLPATSENLETKPVGRPFKELEFFSAGEIVTVSGRYAEADAPYVVLKCDGEKANVAKLGGNGNKYWRGPVSTLPPPPFSGLGPKGLSQGTLGLKTGKHPCPPPPPTGILSVSPIAPPLHQAPRY